MIHQILTWIYTKILSAIPIITFRNKMVNPKIDEGEIFSFFARPNMQIGLPNFKFATQITPEGRLYTGAAEYVFFINKRLLNKRIWTLKKGYLPAVCYNIKNDGVEYRFEIFQFYLDSKEKSRQINYVKIECINNSNDIKECSIAVGIKFHGRRHRPILAMNGGMMQTRFKLWKYKFENNHAIRGNKLLYLTSETPSKYWKNIHKQYHSPFTHFNKNKIVLISEFNYRLNSKSKSQIIIKIPHYPINITDLDTINKLKDIKWDDIYKEFEKFWDGMLSKGIKISLPENKVINTSKTNLIFNFMTQDYDNSKISQKVNRFQYNHFWIRDSSFYIRMYNMFGYPEIAKGIIFNILKYQVKDGNFMSQKGQLDGFGQSLWSFAEHIKFTDDVQLAEKLLPVIERAINWFKNTINKDKLGILPSTSAFDNESIIGRYTGHNLWALMGLNSAIYLTKKLNRLDLYKEYHELYDKFFKSFLRQLIKVSNRDFIVPPSLNVKGGVDWGNLLLIYPQKLFRPSSKFVVNTLNNYYNNKMAEGLATWMGYLHHYLTERIAQSFMILEDQEKVLNCFYSMLLHTGSCNEGFEMGIYPWGDRDYEMNYILKFYNFPPHGWFGVAYNTLLRNMLIREEDNNLHLISVLSPEWVRPKTEIKIEKANTYFGIIDYTIKSSSSMITLNFKSSFRNSPDKIIIHLPFFTKNQKASLNSESIPIKNNKIEFTSKSEFVLEVKWELDQKIQMNYKLFVDEYIKKYRQKYSQRKYK
ncbi:MAG: hypothetical protein ACTSWR_10600 [Candidatus Helarchaeota archaeon]